MEVPEIVAMQNEHADIPPLRACQQRQLRKAELRAMQRRMVA
jgi:hypothetical protein